MSALSFRRRRTMDVIEALAGQKAGRLLLVDVREASERARGFVPGSLHVPLGGLDAHNVAGGMTAWERHHLETTR